MTKQEIIKQAYGEHWASFNYLTKECAINNNGWISISLQHPPKSIDLDFGEKNIYRPKSLQGIYTNNGWIKIESELDLPREVGLNYYCTSRESVSNNTINSEQIIDCWNAGIVTHYQPIIKLKPPIY